MSTVTVAPPAGSMHTGGAPKKRSGSKMWVWVLVPIVFLLMFFLYPIVQIVVQTFFNALGEPVGFDTWAKTFSSDAFWTSLWVTFEVAGLATVGCVLVGTFFAFILAFVPFPGGQLLRRMIQVVVSFPSFIIPLAFTVLYGNAGVFDALMTGIFGDGFPTINITNSVMGVVFAEIAFYTPFVTGPVLAAFSRVSKDEISVAGSLGAKPWRVVRSVIIPEVLPAIAASTILTFLLTMNEFGIILFTGAKGVITLPMQIYTNSVVTFDFSSASVMATVLIVLAGVIYILYRQGTKRWTQQKESRA